MSDDGAEQQVAIEEGSEKSADEILASRPMTLREIANFLAISDDVARDLLRKKKIRSFKAGGQWRAMPQEVAEFVIRQLSKP